MRVVFVLIAALFAGAAAAAAAADSAGPPQPNPPPRHPYPKREHVRPSPITDHFALRGTFFAAQLNTDLHLDSSATAPGTLLNAEHDLGLKGHLNQGRMELIFRLHERHRLRVDYFGSDRDGDRAIGQDILFGGHTFMSGDLVQSDLQYRWARNFEIGLGYEEIRAQLSVQRSSTTPGGFTLSVKGPELFLRASF